MDCGAVIMPQQILVTKIHCRLANPFMNSNTSMRWTVQRFSWAMILLGLPVCAAVLWSPNVIWAQSGALPVGEKPADAPEKWKALVGSYVGADKTQVVVLENNGALELQEGKGAAVALHEVTENQFSVSANGQGGAADRVQFVAGGNRSVKEVVVGESHYSRLNYDADTSKSFHVTPVRPVEELRKEALLASPPRESGNFRKPELVELTTLDPTIHLDIRYATSNNFLGTPLYTEARAFLQRPAAEAMVRALQALKPYGYGLLIHDGYRPWYVTKLFWEATPAEGKIFVADPAQGSRHNRGCAVDLTLYDLKSGKAVEMPGTYDEMSPRSFPDFVGGTSVQRWRRELLRKAMEAQGFTVYEAEWWHFDYKDWREYPILNIPFEQLKLGAATATR
jgi:D-alanyl-D-alanine dipeptidase